MICSWALHILCCLSCVACARQIRDCLRETEQIVPHWLDNACSNKQHWKYVDMCRQASQGSAGVGAVADRGLHPARWKGRGSGFGLERRNAWLQECSGQGAAREPVT